MKIDFHIHTQASNGQFSSKQVIDQAIEKGLKAIAITDHDTILGLDSAFEYAKGKDINIIPGIELDTNNHIGHLHIIGLNINYKDKKFNEKLRLLRDDRNKRNLRFINEFNKIGVNISLEDVNKYVKGDIVSKYHFAQALKEKGYVHSIDEAYDKYFNQGELKKIKTKAFSPEESIKLIKKAGGTAILAHPQTLNLSARDLKAKVKELKVYGLDGMECYHSGQTKDEMKVFRKIAFENNIMASKGSDYHGEKVIPCFGLGTGYNGNIVNNEEGRIYKVLNEHKLSGSFYNKIYTY